MSTPLIAIPSILAARANEEYLADKKDSELRLAGDPIYCGYDTFAQQPRDLRQKVIGEMFKIATIDELDQSSIEAYTVEVAAAVVNTVSSTGLTSIPSSLLYRALAKHYTFEASRRANGESNALSAEVVGVLRKLEKADRNEFAQQIRDASRITVYNNSDSLLFFLRNKSEDYTTDTTGMYSTLLDKAKVEMPTPTDFDKIAAQLKEPIEAKKLVLAGLSGVITRVNAEAKLIIATRAVVDTFK